MCKYQLGIWIKLVLESLFSDSQPLSTYVTRIILFIVVLFHNDSCLSKRKYFPFFSKLTEKMSMGVKNVTYVWFQTSEE